MIRHQPRQDPVPLGPDGAWPSEGVMTGPGLGKTRLASSGGLATAVISGSMIPTHRHRQSSALCDTGFRQSLSILRRLSRRVGRLWNPDSRMQPHIVATAAAVAFALAAVTGCGQRVLVSGGSPTLRQFRPRPRPHPPFRGSSRSAGGSPPHPTSRSSTNMGSRSRSIHFGGIRCCLLSFTATAQPLVRSMGR